MPLPGACAVITALSASGLPSDRFSFEGFLPPKSKGRKDKFLEIASVERTCIFYESPHRILDSLQDMLDVLGPEREVVLARELTKTFETIQGMPLGELIEWVKSDDNQQRGEMVLLIHGHRDSTEESLPDEATRTLGILTKELPLKKAAALAAEIYSLKKNAFIQVGLGESGLKASRTNAGTLKRFASGGETREYSGLNPALSYQYIPRRTFILSEFLFERRTINSVLLFIF